MGARFLTAGRHLKHAKRSLRQNSQQRLHPTLLTSIARRSPSSMTLLANDATSTERVEIIRSLIDTVTFDPAPALDLRLS
jgi:hypothetical protein